MDKPGRAFLSNIENTIKFNSNSCLPTQVGFAAFVNIVGAIFAIIGIVLYAIDLGDVSVVWMCNDNNFDDNCRHVAYFAQVGLIFSRFNIQYLYLQTLTFESKVTFKW